MLVRTHSPIHIDFSGFNRCDGFEQTEMKRKENKRKVKKSVNKALLNLFQCFKWYNT